MIDKDWKEAVAHYSLKGCNEPPFHFLGVFFRETNIDVDKATFLNELAKTIQVYQEAEGRTEEYHYDAAGNRILQRITLIRTSQYSSKYYPDSDRLMTDGKYAYEYDAAGNLIKKGNR